jgi:hypothetical protein
MMTLFNNNGSVCVKPQNTRGERMVTKRPPVVHVDKKRKQLPTKSTPGATDTVDAAAAAGGQPSPSEPGTTVKPHGSALLTQLVSAMFPDSVADGGSLCAAPRTVTSVENYTSFKFDVDEHLMLSMLYMRQDVPEIMNDKEVFLEYMAKAFDESKGVQGFIS